MTKNIRGLIIEVSKDRYDAYIHPGSKRDMLLALIVKLEGGINHTVKPGLYEFKVFRKGLMLHRSLLPWINK